MSRGITTRDELEALEASSVQAARNAAAPPAQDAADFFGQAED